MRERNGNAKRRGTININILKKNCTKNVNNNKNN